MKIMLMDSWTQGNLRAKSIRIFTQLMTKSSFWSSYSIIMVNEHMLHVHRIAFEWVKEYKYNGNLAFFFFVVSAVNMREFRSLFHFTLNWRVKLLLHVTVFFHSFFFFFSQSFWNDEFLKINGVKDKRVHIQPLKLNIMNRSYIR